MEVSSSSPVEPTIAGREAVLGCVVLSAIVIGLALLGRLMQREPQTDRVGRGTHFQVDLNQATEAELMALPDLGPQTARKIIDYRIEQGPFTDIEQLGRVQGIGPATMRTLRPMLLIDQAQPGHKRLAQN